jgi:cytochrome P450
MKPSSDRIAPGPTGHWLLGSIREFKRDVLGLMMESARAHGDVVRFRLGPQVIHLLNHPEHVHHVLLRNHQNFDKNTRSAAFIKGVTGESLLTANGEFWQRQRRLLQPAFHKQLIASFTTQMTESAARVLEEWRKRGADSGPLDVASEMMRLTYTVVGRTLFSADVGPDADTINRAMHVILPHTFERLGHVFNWPEWVPTPANVRFHRALRAIDTTVFRIIGEHRRSMNAEDTNPGDLLTTMLGMRDEATGEGLGDEQLRNETITFLLAGHETTANALTWIFYLLSQNPGVEQRLREEADTVLGGRAPASEDLPRLVYTKWVVMEAMRLYPPIWIIERRVIHDDAVSGFHLPAGSSIVIAPYALHRHPSFWENPEKFDPLRFEHPPPDAYIPFGAGPRFCIGKEFAMLEAQVITAMVIQSFTLRAVPGHRVEPWPGITLRARYGLLMTVRERSAP